MSTSTNSILTSTQNSFVYIRKFIEVLCVQNPFGTWSAPKGHWKVVGGMVETPEETAWRELFEEIKIIITGTDKELNPSDIKPCYSLDKHRYREYRFYNTETTQCDRVIGLFLINMKSDHEENWDFRIKDSKENQVLLHLML